MQRANPLLIAICFWALAISCEGQKSFGKEQLTLNQTIILPGVKGRIDHLSCNLQDEIVYVAALGNNTLEVVDLKKSKSYSIKGSHEPQGVAYIPQTKEIMVANGASGTCDFYDAGTFEVKAT